MTLFYILLSSAPCFVIVNIQSLTMDRRSGEPTNEVKNLIVSLKIENHKTCETVRLLNISESTVRSVWNKYIKRGSVENLPRVGRPRKLSHRDENWILNACSQK